MSKLIGAQKFNIVNSIIRKLQEFPKKQADNMLHEIHDAIGCDFYYKGLLYNNYASTNGELVELPEDLHQQMDNYLFFINKFTQDIRNIHAYLKRALNQATNIIEADVLTDNLFKEYIVPSQYDMDDYVNLDEDMVRLFKQKNKQYQELYYQYKTLRLVIGN